MAHQHFLQLPTVPGAQACVGVTGTYPTKHSSVPSISSVSHCHTSLRLCKTSFQMCKIGDGLCWPSGRSLREGCPCSAPAGEDKGQVQKESLDHTPSLAVAMGPGEALPQHPWPDLYNLPSSPNQVIYSRFKS